MTCVIQEVLCTLADTVSVFPPESAKTRHRITSTIPPITAKIIPLRLSLSGFLAGAAGWTGSAAAMVAPQFEQRRAPAGFICPHDGQGLSGAGALLKAPTTSPEVLVWAAVKSAPH